MIDKPSTAQNISHTQDQAYFDGYRASSNTNNNNNLVRYETPPRDGLMKHSRADGILINNQYNTLANKEDE